MTNPITNVHQALQAAATETEAAPAPMIHATYRVEVQAKALASQICERNGTTLSAYLRACTHALIKDYQAPATPAQE